jgi:pyrroloquinoline quinone biosynthesis protein D
MTGSEGGIDQRPVLRSIVKMRFDPVRQKHVLLLPERAVLLNESGAEILSLCDGTRTAEQVIDTLTAKYPDADLRPDVMEFLGAAATRGWIEWIPP